MILLGGQCRVEKDGENLGLPPCASATGLLIGLAVQGNSWTCREILARKLYPDSDHARRTNALRQTVFRLRKWLGEDDLEFEGELARLTPKSWSLDFSVEGEPPANAAMIAPGLRHPWIDEVRLKQCPNSDRVPSSMMRGFSDSVMQIAVNDPDAARGLFVSAANFLEHFTVEGLIQISAVISPKSNSDPHAADFHAMGARLAYTNCLFQEAKILGNLALKCKPSRKTAISIVTLLYFLAIESGDRQGVVEFRRMLMDLRIEVGLNAITMCEFWNDGNFSEAALCRNGMFKELHKLTRSERVQFLLNMAYFSADIGDTGCCEEALSEIDQLLPADADFTSLTLRHNIMAKLFLLRRDAEAAQQSLVRANAAWQQSGRMMQKLYIMETQSEVSASLGKYEPAQIEWANFIRRRKKVGIAMTPRLERQQQRVLV